MLKNVEALRFLAAMSVVLLHVLGHYQLLDGFLLEPLERIFLPWGKFGVDVFFVVSGLVIWLSTERRSTPRDILPFYLRRAARIYVSYWPWLIVAAALATATGRIAEMGDVNWLAQLTLWRPREGYILGVSWTLTFEMMFYMVFGLAMLLPRRAIPIVVTAWGVYCLISSGQSQDLWASPLIAEFAAGVLVAVTIQMWKDRIPLALLLLAAAGFLWVAVSVEQTELNRALFAGGFAVCLVMAAVRAEAMGIVAPNTLIKLGAASYALYLCHLPILTFARTSLHWRFVKANPDLVFGGVIVVSLLVAWVWWVVVEAPTNRTVRKLAVAD